MCHGCPKVWGVDKLQAEQQQRGKALLKRVICVSRSHVKSFRTLKHRFTDSAGPTPKKGGWSEVEISGEEKGSEELCVLCRVCCPLLVEMTTGEVVEAQS